MVTYRIKDRTILGALKGKRKKRCWVDERDKEVKRKEIMKAGKIWGQTELIHANGVLEFHRIEYKKMLRVQYTNINLNGTVSL